MPTPSQPEMINDIDERNLLENDQCILTDGIIDNLAGMQYAKNLRAFIHINTTGNGVKDLSPLSELYNLEVLCFEGL